MSAATPVCTTEVGISRQVLSVLGMMNVVEGFTMNVIWPFLPFMVEEFGVATEDTVGLYVGILGKKGDCQHHPIIHPLGAAAIVHKLQVPVTTLQQPVVLSCGAFWQINSAGDQLYWLALWEHAAPT